MTLNGIVIYFETENEIMKYSNTFNFTICQINQKGISNYLYEKEHSLYFQNSSFKKLKKKKNFSLYDYFSYKLTQKGSFQLLLKNIKNKTFLCMNVETFTLKKKILFQTEQQLNTLE